MFFVLLLVVFGTGMAGCVLSLDGEVGGDAEGGMRGGAGFGGV